MAQVCHMKDERQNVLRDKDFAKVVHTEENWKKEIREILEEMKNEKERISRSKRGKEIADGLGRKRVMKIVERILQEKLSSSV